MSTAAQPRNIVGILFALVLAESISSFEGAMIFTAVPQLYASFNDPVLVGWIITAFGLVMVASTAIGARLGDLFGRRRVLLICIGLAATGSLISAVSHSAWGVIVGRAVQGLSGPLLPLSYGLVREYLPPNRMPLGIGLIAATAIFTAGIAALIAGVLIDSYHWSSIFYFSAGLSLIALPIVAWLLPPTQGQRGTGRLDLLGGIGLVIPVSMVAFAIGKIRAWGWEDPRLLGLMLAGLGGLALWAWYELRQEKPLIDVRLLVNRRVVTANLSLVMIGAGAMQASMVLSLLIQQPVWTGSGLGLSATVVGSVLFTSQIMALIAGPAAGLLSSRFGPRLPIALGGLLLTFVWTLALLKHDSIVLLGFVMLLNGFGQTIVFAAAPILITATVPMDRSSEANGLSNIFRQTGMALTTQILSLLLAIYSFTAPEHGSGTFVSETGFRVAFGYMAVASFVCVLIAMTLRRDDAKVGG